MADLFTLFADTLQLLSKKSEAAKMLKKKIENS